MTGPDPNHTFVVPAYKESPYLEDCLFSLKKQSISSRILITTSTPNNFIENLAARHQIPLFVNPRGKSIGSDWNFAFEKAETELVTIAHQDDVYLPDFTRSCLEASSMPEADDTLIVITRPELFLNDQRRKFPVKNMVRNILLPAPGKRTRLLQTQKEKQGILRFANPVSCPGVCFIKKNLPGFRFSENEKYVLDWRAWWELSKRNGSFLVLSDKLHIHREHADSASSVTDKKVREEEEQNLLNEIWGGGIMPHLLSFFLKAAK